MGTNIISISIEPRAVENELLGSLGRLLNTVVQQNLPVGNIHIPAGWTDTSRSSPHFILEVEFLSGTKVFLKVGPMTTLSDEVRISYALEPNGVGTPFNLIPRDAEVMSGSTRRRLVSLFLVHLDGDEEIGVRFDQWLVHHILGTDYPANPTTAPIDHGDGQNPGLDQVFTMLGISSVRSFDGDSSVLRWFLLFAANAGNREVDSQGDSVNFLNWLAQQGVTDIATLSADQIFTYFQTYGLGVGFVPP